MIRFKPDTWWDVAMRPLDMISPEANTYVEIPAPDLRLAAVLVLAVAVALLGNRRAVRESARPSMILLAVTLLAMIPWFWTTGNGRYFIPFLIVLGPVCVGLLSALPLTRGFRVAMALLLVSVQLFLVAQASPLGSWGWLAWRSAPYFQVDRAPSEPDVTYVTVSSISYSLIAPQFPATSRWINLTAQGATPRDGMASHAFLAAAEKLVLVAPSIPAETGADGNPTQAVRKALDQLLRGHELQLKAGARCGLLRSRGMAAILRLDPASIDSGAVPPAGFWLCPLAFQPAPAEGTQNHGAPLNDVFEAVERTCPRFFKPNEAPTQRIDIGFVRMYASSDTKLYVYDTGQVMYKFWRSINPVMIGTVETIRSGDFKIDCSRIRAPNWRTGGV